MLTMTISITQTPNQVSEIETLIDVVVVMKRETVPLTDWCLKHYDGIIESKIMTRAFKKELDTKKQKLIDHLVKINNVESDLRVLLARTIDLEAKIDKLNKLESDLLATNNLQLV